MTLFLKKLMWSIHTFAVKKTWSSQVDRKYLFLQDINYLGLFYAFRLGIYIFFFLE